MGNRSDDGLDAPPLKMRLLSKKDRGVFAAGIT
jgi:hypothetical protein